MMTLHAMISSTRDLFVGPVTCATSSLLELPLALGGSLAGNGPNSACSHSFTAMVLCSHLPMGEPSDAESASPGCGWSNELGEIGNHGSSNDGSWCCVCELKS